MDGPLPFSLNLILLDKTSHKNHPTEDTRLEKFITCYHVCNNHPPLQKHLTVSGKYQIKEWLFKFTIWM